MVKIGSRFPGRREIVRIDTDTGEYEHVLPKFSDDALRLQSALLTKPKRCLLDAAWSWRAAWRILAY